MVLVNVVIAVTDLVEVERVVVRAAFVLVTTRVVGT